MSRRYELPSHRLMSVQSAGGKAAGGEKLQSSP